ncbi:MAG: TIGR00341 family protein [Methyloprofundus sp.]|nr:TIGR00341 family protein [Methyloprofundus sp.]
MATYVRSALFITGAEDAVLSQQLQGNEFATGISSVDLAAVLDSPKRYLDNIQHVVVAGSLADIKAVLSLAIEYDFSVGLIADKSEKILLKSFDLPLERSAAIELALRAEPPAIDIILCNGQVLLFKAVIGWLPLLDSKQGVNKFNFILNSIQHSFHLKLLPFSFITAKGKKVKTAASGCMIIQRHRGSLISKLIKEDSSIRDGSISMLVSSPVSILVYFNILLRLLTRAKNHSALPRGIGFIKTSQLDIESSPPLKVLIDGHCTTRTPLRCVVLPSAVRVNIGEWQDASNKRLSAKESVKVAYLPNEKELEQVSRQKIPFFSHASEQRFRELFVALREDAQIGKIYITLMILSTMLATVGLFQSSTAVLIGAMLLAPLMAPIVSLAMGLLRGNSELLKKSLLKIALGITLALFASALITQIFPYKMLTGEMSARINPSLLDLAVAIIAGISAAYSKSHKEIMQSLAGVAIAVALVPPLAVAGIGIGRGNLEFFLQAFLLFSTNLTGITLAATFTFRFLGYSPIVHAKRGIGLVLILFMLISVPLYTSYQRIVESIALESLLESSRFLVNGKYIIVNNSRLSFTRGERVIFANILARDEIDRADMIDLKRKIKMHFKEDIIVRVRILYVL